MSHTCATLHGLLNGLSRYRYPFVARDLPRNGVYVLFEEGERAHGGDRIVRVGTHTGADKLPSRLREHFVKENKDRSILRKNIGRALLARAGDPFLTQWNVDLMSRRAREAPGHTVNHARLAAVEAEVSAHIRERFSFIVLRVDDREERLALESRLIATVSWCEECRPSAGWLGLHSPNDKIRGSGLWLVNELWKEPLSEGELARVTTLCAEAEGPR